MITKEKLDKLVKQYEIPTFCDDDPSQFLRRYKKYEDVEISSFLAALFSFGKREMFIKKLNEIFEIMGKSPYKYILNFNENNTDFDNFVYRFIKGNDLKSLILCLKELYSNGNTLKMLFEHGYKTANSDIIGMLTVVTDYFYANSLDPESRGFKHLLPNPRNGSAMKRFCMFLRWMIREGAVDIGLWNFMPKSALIIPMDTHVIQQAVKMGLLNNAKADFKSAQKLTDILKNFDKDDPTKYDFALFGYGIDND